MEEVPFRANDIRGLYPDEISEPLFYHLGLVLPKILNSKKIAIGRDIRLSSNSLFSMLCEGLNAAGCDVLDLGLCDTPYTYFISGKYDLACLMITASHNPKEYNGLKMVNPNSIPINENQISQLLKALKNVKHSKHTHNKKEGKIIHFDKKKEYISYLLEQVDKKSFEKMKIVVDCSNGMAPIAMKSVFAKTPANVIYINDSLDGSFPAHTPNPAIKENLSQLQRAVKKEKANLGIIFDGDCDRVAFVDESGEIIDSSLTAAIFAHHFLHSAPNPMVYTTTTGMIMKETIDLYGGKSILTPVGHRFVKESMIKSKAVFGAEPSGHYYFKSNYYADSGLIGALLFYEILSKAKTPASLISKTFHKYISLGEINYQVKDREKSFKKIKSFIKSCDPDEANEIDGYSAIKTNSDGHTIHITVRKSNTEPFLRVTIESNSMTYANQFRQHIEVLIKNG